MGPTKPGLVCAMDVLHGQEDAPADDLQVVDPADIGVCHLPGQPDLGNEPFPGVWIPGQVIGEELERHDLPEPAFSVERQCSPVPRRTIWSKIESASGSGKEGTWEVGGWPLYWLACGSATAAW